jgi:glucose/arabinose dehydrogenase
VLLKLDQPYGNHNGGDVRFGADGKLYVGTGDGGAANDPLEAGQDDSIKLAKMLRIDVDAGAGTVEIVSKGLRNPWRSAFDPKTGDLYIADVGQNEWEFIHVVGGDDIDGHNFGWNTVEGTHCFREDDCDKAGLTLAVIEYPHSEGCSITGGVVYRGAALPALDGVYFYADFCTTLFRSFRWSAGSVSDHWDWQPVFDPDEKMVTVSAFGVNADGEMYVTVLEGDVYRMKPAG